MKNYRRHLKNCLIAVIGLGLSIAALGCQGETKGRPEPVVTKKIVPVAGAPGLKPAKSKSTTKRSQTDAQDAPSKQADKLARLPYDPAGKLDPFRALFKEEPQPKTDQIQKPQKPERPRTPLERLELGQLRLTAVVFSEIRPRAMVEEDNGKGYVVGIGTPIGLERGQVKEISTNRIVIEHLETDDFGNTATRRRELKLQKPVGD